MAEMGRVDLILNEFLLQYTEASASLPGENQLSRATVMSGILDGVRSLVNDYETSRPIFVQTIRDQTSKPVG